MKKIGLLIGMALCVTVGGVYATWTYTQNTDVADETVNMTMNLTDVTYSGSYGTYKVDVDTLKLKIDPKAGTTHTTALYAEGEIVITFTPNSVAPETVKTSGVASTFKFGLSNPDWKYEGQPIVTLTHDHAESITWSTPDADGVFSYTIPASDIDDHITLTEFNLDTKAKYDAYNTELAKGQITITVSDGITV